MHMQPRNVISEIRQQIFARFDEEMDEKTINKQNMFVTEDQLKMRVSGIVRWNPTLRTAIFEPAKNLYGSICILLCKKASRKVSQRGRLI